MADIVVNMGFYGVNWANCRLSDLPIPIYGLDNIPSYYDFIVIDENGNNVGVVTTFARKESNRMIYKMAKDIKKYDNPLTRSVSKYRFYTDRNGVQYISEVSTKGQGELPALRNIETGEIFIPKNRYNKDEEILKFMQDSILPKVYKDTEALIVAKDEMRNRMLESKENSKIFWAEVDKIVDDLSFIDNISFRETKLTKGINEVFQIKENRDAITKNGGSPFISKYEDSKYYCRYTSHFCGQFLCGYILNANNFGYFDPTRDIGVGPMMVENISHALEIRSNNALSASNVGRSDWDCYWHILEGQAALRLLINWQGESTQWHWTMMYGAHRDVRFWSTSYYFLQMDNSTLIGWEYRVNRNPWDLNNYSELQWFDTRFYLND